MAADSDSLLIIQFARSPEKGRVKTRMIPHLSASQACDLHCQLTLWTCSQLLGWGVGKVEMSVAGSTDHRLFRQCAAMGVADVSVQCGSDLGERMHNAMLRGLAHYRRVIVVGSDCPSIDAAYLDQAAQGLQVAPLVLGPATDGGYVLIGARQIDGEIFKAIPWGTDQVFDKTLAALKRIGLRWSQLPYLSDVDRPEDLAEWEALKARGQGHSLSV